MVLEYYYDFLSQPSRAVYLFMKCSGVQFKENPVNLMKGEHLTPEFAKKNPFKKVPIIIDDGFPLSESSAIMRYVAVKQNLPDHWYPRADPKKQAREDEFLHWQQFALRKPCVDIFIETLSDKNCKAEVPIFPKRAVDQEKIKAAKEALAKSLDHIVDYYLKGGNQFIAGDKVSAADILGVSELYQLHGVALLDSLVRNNKKAGEWMDRVIKALEPEFSKATTLLSDLNKKCVPAKK